MRRLLALSIALGGCAAAPPLPLDDARVLRDIAGRYRAFFPVDGDPDALHDAGLLRPRFGLPAIVQTGEGGAPFAITTLERNVESSPRAALLDRLVTDSGAARCLGGERVDGCHPIIMKLSKREPVDVRVTLATWSARPEEKLPPGPYDLYLDTMVDAPVRMPRTVWLREGDPAAPASIRVAELADLHVGKGDEATIEQHLREVIGNINLERPDLVLIAGDIMNSSGDPILCAKARELLLTIDAPVAVVMGNHDHGFGKVIRTRAYGEGWESFGRTFHPSLFYEMSLGGWDFIGFDSGPSSMSPRVLTRGIAPETVELIRERLATSRAAGHRGVILFSHTPTRAVLSDTTAEGAHGLFGQMREGGRALEQVMLDAAANGQRVIHLAGHTHWSDVFEARPNHKSKDALGFERWPWLEQKPSFTPIHGRAALITVQSASHGGMPGKPSARGYGFAWLRLGDGDPEVAFQRHGLEGPDRSLPMAQGDSRPAGKDHVGDRNGDADCDEDSAASNETAPTR